MLLCVVTFFLICVARWHLLGEGEHAGGGVQSGGDWPQPSLHCCPRHCHLLWGRTHQKRGLWEIYEPLDCLMSKDHFSEILSSYQEGSPDATRCYKCIIKNLCNYHLFPYFPALYTNSLKYTMSSYLNALFWCRSVEEVTAGCNKFVSILKAFLSIISLLIIF